MANPHLEQIYVDLNRVIFRRKMYDPNKKAFFEVLKDEGGVYLGPSGKEWGNMQAVDDYIKSVKK